MTIRELIQMLETFDAEEDVFVISDGHMDISSVEPWEGKYNRGVVIVAEAPKDAG